MKDWRNYFINFSMFYARFMGFTGIVLDLENRHLKHSKIWNVIIFVGNIGFVYLLPYATKMNLRHVQLNVKNPLIAYAMVINIYIRLMFLILVMVMRWTRDCQMERWYKKLLAIQTEYYDRLPSVQCDVSLRKWSVFSFIIMVFHGVSSIANIYEMRLTGDEANFLDIYVIGCTINLQHCILWNHSLLLSCLHEFCSKLNYQLEQNELDPKLSLIYYQVTCLVVELNDIFSPVVLWIQLCLIISNSIVGYVLILYFSSSNVDLSSYAFVLGDRLYILLCLHMAVYFMLGHWMVDTFRKTQTILKYYIAGQEFEEVEVMALNLSLLKVNISIRGMFNIDLSCYFSIIAQTALFTIYLVQVELQNENEKKIMC